MQEEKALTEGEAPTVAELLEESLAQRPVESITILSRDGEPAKKSDDHH
jgi:hypothetical protein